MSSDPINFSTGLREQLLQILSHDVYSPLRFCTMIGKAVLTQKDNLSKEDIIDALNDINLTSTRMLLLLSNILKGIEFEKSNYNPLFTSENLYNLVQEKIDFLDIIAKHKDLCLLNESDKTITIKTDKSVLSIILQNLLTNAIKFTEKGNVQISANVEGDFLFIQIIDTGIGMPQKIINSILKNEQPHLMTDTENLKGNGLGWSLIKELLKHINGSFSITSIINTGTTIQLKLPYS